MCRNSNSFGMEAQHLGASLVSFCCVTMFMSIPALPPSTASWKWSPPCRFVEDPIRQCYKKHEYMVWHVEDVKNTMVIPRQEPEESGVGREAGASWWNCEVVVPNQISNPEVRGDSESVNEENENENRRFKQRSLFHEKANTKLCKCSFCTRFCSWSMGHGTQ